MEIDNVSYTFKDIVVLEGEYEYKSLFDKSDRYIRNLCLIILDNYKIVIRHSKYAKMIYYNEIESITIKTIKKTKWCRVALKNKEIYSIRDFLPNIHRPGARSQSFSMTQTDRLFDISKILMEIWEKVRN